MDTRAHWALIPQTFRIDNTGFEIYTSYVALLANQIAAFENKLIRGWPDSINLKTDLRFRHFYSASFL